MLYNTIFAVTITWMCLYAFIRVFNVFHDNLTFEDEKEKEVLYFLAVFLGIVCVFVVGGVYGGLYPYSIFAFVLLVFIKPNGILEGMGIKFKETSAWYRITNLAQFIIKHIF